MSYEVEIRYTEADRDNERLRRTQGTRIITECSPPLLRVETNPGRVRTFVLDGVEEVDVWESNEEDSE